MEPLRIKLRRSDARNGLVFPQSMPPDSLEPYYFATDQSNIDGSIRTYLLVTKTLSPLQAGGTAVRHSSDVCHLRVARPS